MSVQENINTTGNSGKLQSHILSALAELERTLNRERTMAGLRAVRARGNVDGRPRALNEEEIQRTARLINHGKTTVRDICEMLGISKTTLYRYLGPDGERRR